MKRHSLKALLAQADRESGGPEFDRARAADDEVRPFDGATLLESGAPENLPAEVRARFHRRVRRRRQRQRAAVAAALLALVALGLWQRPAGEAERVAEHGGATRHVDALVDARGSHEDAARDGRYGQVGHRPPADGDRLGDGDGPGDVPLDVDEEIARIVEEARQLAERAAALHDTLRARGGVHAGGAVDMDSADDTNGGDARHQANSAARRIAEIDLALDIEEAAAWLLAQAERLERAASRDPVHAAQQVAAAYQDLDRHFPATHSAAAARRRLAELGYSLPEN